MNSIIILILSFVLTIVIMPLFIPVLRKLKFGQSVREDGPQSHLAKQGTPTMGGIVFVIATILSLIVCSPKTLIANPTLSITIVFIGYFLIGLLDDMLIIVKKKNDGVSPKMKLLLQALVVIVLFFVTNYLFTDPKYTTLSIFNFHIDLQRLYVIFALFMFVAYSNAVNLTDGLDGLSSITVAISLAFMSVIAYTQQNYEVLKYLLALIGALLGFFVFNKKPAKIFMGDTGSLALGGFYAIIALLLKVELLSIVIGFIFVLETLSVLIQVFSYKTTKKRVFRMAPIHHHFEMGHLKEKGTVYFFYLLAIIFGLVGMVLYYV